MPAINIDDQLATRLSTQLAIHLGGISRPAFVRRATELLSLYPAAFTSPSTTTASNKVDSEATTAIQRLSDDNAMLRSQLANIQRGDAKLDLTRDNARSLLATKAHNKRQAKIIDTLRTDNQKLAKLLRQATGVPKP